MDMRNFIKINGVTIPQPHRGLNVQIATIVDSARNTDGVVVGQVVGKPIQKLNNLNWVYLTAEEWGNILRLLQDFYVTVEFPDPVTGTWLSRRMYPGDRSAEPFIMDERTGLPKSYINCKVNLIDVGD